MAKVIFGSARSDENGGAHGGKAGDQNKGKEVSTQDWYLHKKGWRVLRAKDPDAAERIAAAMQAACDNNHIGYDQYQRDTLLRQAAKVSPPYWPGKDAVIVDTETDCSALVRVCCAFAFGRDVIGNVIGESRFSTANQVSFMLKTGLFEEKKGDQYTKHPEYLMRGDVLVTCTQGHTVVALSTGDKAEPKPAPVHEIIVTGKSVNIRSGAGTTYSIKCVAHKGDVFTYDATGDVFGTTWYRTPKGWISGKYTAAK